MGSKKVIVNLQDRKHKIIKSFPDITKIEYGDMNYNKDHHLEYSYYEIEGDDLQNSQIPEFAFGLKLYTSDNDYTFIRNSSYRYVEITQGLCSI